MYHVWHMLRKFLKRSIRRRKNYDKSCFGCKVMGVQSQKNQITMKNNRKTSYSFVNKIPKQNSVYMYNT